MRNKYTWLFLIVALAAFMRLYNLSTTPPGLYPDEAMNGNNAVEAMETGDYKVFYPENNGREGLFINIQAVFLKYLPHTPETLRLPSAIFGILTIFGLYLLAKEIFAERKRHEKEIIALLSSFFLAVSFWHINFSRIGFRAIMAPFFAVFAVYFFLKAMNIPENSRKEKTKIYSYAIIGGIFFGLGFYSYIAYRVLPFLFLLFILFFYKERKFWKITLTFIVATAIAAAPLGLYFSHNPADFLGRTSQISIFNSPTPIHNLAVNTVKTLGMFNFQGDGNFRHNFAGEAELYWPVGILFIIGVLLLLGWLAKGIKKGVMNKDNFPVAAIFGWMILAMLPVIVSDEGLPHALRAILMVPPVFILAGLGGEYVFRKFKEHSRTFRRFSFVFALVFLILLSANVYEKYFISWADNINVQGAFAADDVEMGNVINTLPKESPKYILVESGGVLVNGIPMPAQTVMFMTDTYTSEKQKEKNVFYFTPEDKISIPDSAYFFKI